jgi:hypothetical protein
MSMRGGGLGDLWRHVDWQKNREKVRAKLGPDEQGRCLIAQECGKNGRLEVRVAD